MRLGRALCFASILIVWSSVSIAGPGNLLNNSQFTDDWISQLFETKNHHWSYSSEYQNRRDYNPDNWWCKGNWQWAGPGRLVLGGPKAQISQRVNWIAVHDDRARSGFPDAGKFPNMAPQSSKRPLSVVRDLLLKVTLSGVDVPEDAGVIELALCPPGGNQVSDPMGSATAPTVLASVALPTGEFSTSVEVNLEAARWLKAVEAAENPGLPATVRVSIRYNAPKGEITVERVDLRAAEPSSPNLLPGGGFERVDERGYPAGWGGQQKYGYFPPGTYYMFNTWHNRGFPNRGPVQTDTLIAHSGRHSLKMIVPPGDDKFVASDPIILNQTEPRLIEVSAWVKTDHLNVLQIDAVDEKGRRLDGFNFIHKAPMSVGSQNWRMIRQVFRPREPVPSIRLRLCARGVNGYTLDDTGYQPQNTVVGHIWWDDVRVYEPESTVAELAVRGVAAARVDRNRVRRQVDVRLCEQLFGINKIETSERGGDKMRATLELVSPSGEKTVYESKGGHMRGGRLIKTIEFPLDSLPGAYTQYRGILSLADGSGKRVSTELWFGAWPSPIDLELGSLYLLPGQKQFVRMNLGLSSKSMKEVAAIRLEVVRRATGKVLKTVRVPATAGAIKVRREKIPKGLRGDFRNLLLVDLDVSSLPLQPFNDPQRNWAVRATLLGSNDRPLNWDPVISAPFCRLAHDPPQRPIKSASIKGNLFYINDKPWMPWGAIYGHIPIYDGPADPGEGNYRDLRNLAGWSYYDGFTSAPYSRHRNDFNCLRYFPGYGKVTDPRVIDGLRKAWKEDNLYAATFFIVKSGGAYSVGELIERTGGKDKFAEYASFARNAEMVASVGPGIEEAFGEFHAAGAAKLRGMEKAVRYLRKEIKKPIMVSHGGGWNRFEFEKVPYYDVFDPETEPMYPAQLHVDLWPLVEGKDKVIWLRPQMYEDVPYERWRYHVYVEMMRGCRGWQIAHGPGDQSTFRGLHAEMEFMKPIIYSKDLGPEISIEPWIEHWSRRYKRRTYLVAATTRGMKLGRWQWDDEQAAPTGRSRVTGGTAKAFNFHGVQYVPDARKITRPGAKLVQWVRIDPDAPPANVVLILKTNGRWSATAAWGKFDISPLRKDRKRAYHFLRSFYRNSSGFLSWGYNEKLLDAALGYVPGSAAAIGPLPKAGEWTKLEVPLRRIGASNRLIDGIACMHENGRAWWGQSSIDEWPLLADSLDLPQEELAKTRISVAGLRAGARVRVLFEDREIIAGNGFFSDDFRGQDLYQRFGGAGGYGDRPVALHVYEIP